MPNPSFHEYPKNTMRTENKGKKKYHTRAFKHEGDSVTAVIGLDGDNVIISGALQHLGHVIEIHSHGDVPIAAVVLEALRSEEQSNKGYVAGIHSLERESGGGAVEVGIVNQVLDRL